MVLADQTPAPARRGKGAADAALSTYVTFELGGQCFAVDVAHVREILVMQPLTSLPNAPHGVEGLIDLRGTTVPIMDLAGRLGMMRVDVTASTRLIVCEIDANASSRVLGVMVDRVNEVTPLGPDAIEPPPDLSGGGAIVSGLTRHGAEPGGNMTVLLDLAAVFGTEEPGPFDFA